MCQFSRIVHFFFFRFSGRTFVGFRILKDFSILPFGGEPFVLLFDPITFGSPARKKEIEV